MLAVPANNPCESPVLVVLASLSKIQYTLSILEIMVRDTANLWRRLDDGQYEVDEPHTA